MKSEGDAVPDAKQNNLREEVERRLLRGESPESLVPVLMKSGLTREDAEEFVADVCRARTRRWSSTQRSPFPVGLILAGLWPIAVVALCFVVFAFRPDWLHDKASRTRVRYGALITVTCAYIGGRFWKSYQERR